MRLIPYSFLLIFFLITASGYEYNLNFTYIDGSSGKISDFEGRPLLVDTMATWCEPCKIALAHLYEVKQTLGDGIEILTISVSPSTDDIEGVRKFKEEVELDQDLIFTWYFALDQDDVMITMFEIKNIPTLILMDTEGKIVKKWIGVTDPSVIIAEIDANITYVAKPDNNVNILLKTLANNPAFLITAGIFTILAVYVKVKPKS